MGGGGECPVSGTSRGSSQAQGLIPQLPTFILFTLELNRTFPINLLLLDAVVLVTKLKLFGGGLIQSGFLLSSGSVDSAPGKVSVS